MRGVINLRVSMPGRFRNTSCSPVSNSSICAASPAARRASTFVSSGRQIPASEQPLIFEKYYRSQTVRGIKGTGLGLAIARAVAEAHAGRIELASEPGKGSTFRLILPVIEEKE